MPGIPLKSGADFYVLEAARMRLHNLGADPTEYGDGLIYFNNSDGNNTSRRARIYDGTTFRSLAFLDEIANNEAFNALVGRVDEAEGDIDSLEGRTDALEALFNGSNAKVADNALMLGGQLPSYYAQSSVLAQLRSEFDALYKTLNDDTTGVIDTWQEVVDFVNEYSGSEDLSTILAGMNTQIADRYTKAEADGRFLKLTGGTVNGDTNIIGLTKLLRNALFPLYVENTNPTATGVGIRFCNNGVNTIGLCTLFNTDFLYRYNRDLTNPYIILDKGNYSDLITTLNNTLSVPSITIGGIRLSVVDGRLQIEGNAYATGELAAGGAGEEGGDDMGLALLENWADYDATKAQALGAVLGKDMYDKIVILEGKSTNVQFTPTLSSGKQIGAITIDGVTTGIFAPSSYAWSEIDGRPTSLSQFTDDVVAGNYLPLTGGRMTGNLIMEEGHLVTRQLYAVVDNYYSLGDENRRWTNVHTVLINGGTPIHSENVGEYKAGDSDKLGGYYITQVLPQILRSYRYIEAGTDLDTLINENAGWWNSRDNIDYTNGPKRNFGLFSARINSDYFGQLAFGYGSSELMYRSQVYSSSEKIWRPWRTIAFTDSDITGNADTATKLKTARTIWGQSFDGTRDLTGPMTLDNQNPIRWKSSEDSELDVLTLNATNNLLLGQGVAKAGLDTNIYGYTIRFCYGSAGSVSRTAMTITEEGRVLINYSSAILDRRLSIGSGGVFVNATLSQSPILGSVGSNSLLVGGSDYGMQHWVLGNGQGNIQVGRFNGTAVAYALNLNPLGGNVGIGKTDPAQPLDVNGNILIPNYSSLMSRKVDGTAINLIYAGNDDVIKIGSVLPIKLQGNTTIAGNLHVTGNIIADGEVSAGGAGEEGETESTGNASAWAQTFTPTNTTMPFEHNRATTDVIVQVYEKNDGGSWDMILVDVEIISETKVNLHFGRTENREHKIVIMG